MTKWELRCDGCGCWRSKGATGDCIHKCELCFDKSTEYVGGSLAAKALACEAGEAGPTPVCHPKNDTIAQ